MPTKLKVSDLKVHQDKAFISGEAATVLTQSLISRPAETYGELASSFGFISPSHIEVSADGSLIINNKAAAAKMQELLDAHALAGHGPDGPGFFDTNCSCHKD
jgi:hypothetical protein